MNTNFKKFITELKKIKHTEYQDTQKIMQLVAEQVKQVMQDHSWADFSLCDQIDPKVGSQKICLHEEADHSMAVFITAWLPKQYSLPHTHGTWAVLASFNGAETHTFWQRTDDGKQQGFAKLEKLNTKDCNPGDTFCLNNDIIHGVANNNETPLLTLQVYGENILFTKRSQFNVDQQTEKIINAR